MAGLRNTFRFSCKLVVNMLPCGYKISTHRMNKKKVIIAGGGFAGIQLARKLDQRLFDVLLVDKINHHQFQPLF